MAKSLFVFVLSAATFVTSFSASSSSNGFALAAGLNSANNAPPRYTYDANRGFLADGVTPKFHGKTPTELDEYVYRDDGAFSITDLKKSFRGIDDKYTTHLFNFTSQKWLTPADSSMPIWWHILAVIVPDGVDKTVDTSFLFITGNHNKQGWTPNNNDKDVVIAGAAAVGARCTAAVLFQVPAAPIDFPNDPFNPKRGRTEDAIIGFTWWKYITMGKTKAERNPEWILELPMTKAGVKAIDTMQAVIPQFIGGNPIRKVTVAGLSKRGWTTWLVGAVEAIRPNNRVAAIIPTVLDAVNIYQFLHRQYQAYGKWTFALGDYVATNITELIETDGMREMLEIVDMWYYLDRLTMPKLVVSAGGDEFQMPDNHRHFGHYMPGESKFLVVKNAEHMLITAAFEVISAFTAFIASVQYASVRPTVNWQIDDATGRIFVTTSHVPRTINITYSDSGLGVSAGRRDFRWAALGLDPCEEISGACWRPLAWKTEGTENIHFTSPTAFSALAAPPPAGQWRAFTIELTFASKDSPNDPLLFTAPASVIPVTNPFPNCYGPAECGHEMC